MSDVKSDGRRLDRNINIPESENLHIPSGNLFSNQGTTDDCLPTFLPVDEASSASNTLQSQSETSFTNNIFQSPSENTDVERSNIETPHFCTENSQVPFPRSATQNEPLHPTRPSSSTTLLLETFPCNYPINPHMRSKEARLQTFLDNSTRWPAHRIRATPQQIVDAGMYYLGLRDRVKCWYCNGGLQNWDEEDDPWAEHAKWFPLCEFVLQQKGPEFVHRIVSLYPGLERPPLNNPTQAELAQRIAQQMHLSINPFSCQQTHSNVPVIIDPQEEIRKRNEIIEIEMKTSSVVREARKMGFDDQMIKDAMKKHYQGCGMIFTSLERLIESLLNIESGMYKEDREQSSTPTSGAHTNNNLRVLENSRKCKKCFQQDACVLYMLCGHLVCCEDCAEIARICLLCGEMICEKFRCLFPQ